MSELFGTASDFGPGIGGIAELSDAQQSYADTGINTADQQAERAIAEVLANVGNRSNIRGSENYDPIFAQAFNMSRGLQPGNLVAGDYFGAQNFANQSDLARPSYLQPQVRGDKGMYFSGAERFLQETLPSIVQGASDFGLTGIIKNLGKYGQKIFEEKEEEKKSDVGIMENMDRADATDVQKALRFGYENNPFSGPATQTAFNLRDVLTSPGAINRGLQFVQPYLQQMVPEGFNVKTDPGINYEENTITPRIELEYQFPNKDFGLGSLFRNLG